ncbi:host cell division inhibitor Icd-like protein [Pseudoalteromonas rubra]|uniref:host cell division inhibitor Icd-like protein n=1 Tax=Pseudoalteromonas rubra TaxID=43658 RepID=UPI002DBFED5A|nr:host cell division inhibitor Icd-like protein [Pseudoalteromonas rubra]MEC4090120.1 host cell division inhibitor Icd-like protein [Pseudoalteromonas rubra]
MLYTFLVATGNQTLSKLPRIRTVSAVADTEAQARAQLTGLPLVFVSRNAAKAGA